MPHIVVKMYAGRPDEKKELLAKELKNKTVEVLGCSADFVSVAVEDFTPEEWKTVFQNEIEGNDTVLIKPGYQV